SLWSYTVIEHLFDHVKRVTGNQSTTYNIYGHSAGAQFVHRMVLFMPQARIHVAVAANAGFYTMPVDSIDYPYGIGQSPLTVDRLGTAFQRRLVVLLGTADTDPNHPELCKTSEAEAQGPHRFARGRRFFATAQAMARRLNARLNWRLATVPD